jgi:hypothetical protein
VYSYEWSVLRVVPRVERCEFVNAGVVVYCRQLDFLAAAVELDEARALALDSELDLVAVRRHLQGIEALCEGRHEAGPNAARPPGDRFRWLAAPRSTVVQPSPIHTGLTDDPAAELGRLLEVMVRPRPHAGGGQPTAEPRP